jgi:membrane associated rhomboid family serine protease
VVTLALAVVNVAVFALELSQGRDIDAFVRRWGLVPADFHEGLAAAITLLTSTFLHSGWFHLGANLVYLVVFGVPVERRLGSTRFLGTYLLSGLLGSLAYVVAQPQSQTPAVGASGAVAGVIAAHLVLFPGATLGSLAPVLFLHVVGSAPTLLLLLVWLATQVLSSVASLTTSTGIAWWAHLGGFAGGLVLAPVLRRHRSRGDIS